MESIKNEERACGHSLQTSLYYTKEVFEDVANGAYLEYYWQRRQNMSGRGHNFNPCDGCRPECTAVDTIKAWLHTHEDAQVMLASMLVVVGLWWLVRTVIALLINLICPLLVVVLAVVCVPQLRAPLLGQNYHVLANLLRNILLKMAETIKV